MSQILSRTFPPLPSRTGLRLLLAAGLAGLLLAGCGGMGSSRQPVESARPEASEKGNDIVLYAMSLLDRNYRFGGKNPDAGLDCSGMVSWIYREAAGVKLAGSAADIARRGRTIERQRLRPGDLVFFNTNGRPRSHVGIYIGDNRFVHAPSTNGKIRVEKMENRYFASRFEEARTYFD